MGKIYTISGQKIDYYKTQFTDEEMRERGYDCPKEYALTQGIWSEDKIFSITEGDIRLYYIDEEEF